MRGDSAQKAILNILEYRFSGKQSVDLYQGICNYLLHKDKESYSRLLRLKYALLQDDVDSYVCDYLVMASLLKLMQLKHPLVLAALASLTLHQS